MRFSHLLQYFHDCYQADNRRTTLWNIFEKKVEHRLILNGKEELLNGFLPSLSLDSKKVFDAAKAAYLYRKEKRLVYCSCLILGSLLTGENTTQVVCSPLFLHPATIETDDSLATLSLDVSERQMNYELIAALCGDHDVAAQVYERILSEIPAGALDFEKIGLLVHIFKEYLPQVDTELLFQYPQLVQEKELRQELAALKTTGALKIVPAGVLGLIKRSQEARGVLTELASIAANGDYSRPLRALFEQEPAAAAVQEKKAAGLVPAVLSAPQQRILAAAAAHPLTLAIGPPGTGKSYTIASIAVEHLSRGESVLIASKMDHAVDVVGDKIERQLGMQGCVVRGGRKQYLRDLKDYLQQILHGIIPNGELEQDHVRPLRRRVKQLDKTIARLETAIGKRNRWEIAWGRFLVAEQTRFRGFHPFRSLQRAYFLRKFDTLPSHASIIEQLEQALKEREHLIVSLIRLRNRRRIQRTLKKHRKELQTFLKALRARTGGKQEELFRTINFQMLLDTFPIWLVNLSAIYDVLPLQKEVFDLAIIDEATQCDIASCLPIFQRAKRVIVVGDPKQLRHISFLSKRRQRLLAEKHGISKADQDTFHYREKSILDVVDETISTQEQVLFLDEHYRSVPQIINFSNQEFYSGSLRIMTEKPGAFAQQRVIWTRCQGSRGQNGRNDVEAQQLVADVIALVEDEASLDASVCHSIGILSPFRDQVDYIFHLLSKKLPLATLDKHRLLAGTAYTFQGEERDAMFLSFAIDPEYHANTLHYLNRPDIFNVSITRGRSMQRIYTSLTPPQLKHGSLLEKYLQYIERAQRQNPIESNHATDPFLLDVHASLDQLGIPYWSAYSVAGLKLDLVIEHAGRTYGIDLIGYPGEFSHAFTLERYKMFHRAGLRIFPLPYTAWTIRKEECLAELQRLIGDVRSPARV